MVMLPLYVGGSRVKCVFPSSKNRTRMFATPPVLSPALPKLNLSPFPSLYPEVSPRWVASFVYT